MKILALSVALVAAVALGAGQTFAATSHASTATKVTVVMHDPGCHSFSVNGAFRKSLAVHGPAKLVNLDEATLIVKGAGAVRQVRVGRTVLLAKGAYAITMVKQAADDNHLRLVVR